MEAKKQKEEVQENKKLVFAGLGLTIGSFLMAVITFVVFLIPGSVRESSFPLIQSGICINVIALALGVTGIILTAVAKPKSGVARLNLFFGATGCVVAFACFFLCLCFGAIIPIPELG